MAEPTSVRLSDTDETDIRALIRAGVYLHFADALRGVIRKGIETTRRERGLP